VIPISGFSEMQGKGKNAVYTDFTPENGALAWGGLYREWLNHNTGEITLCCAVITLPPHDKL
tara:strand:+ start:601 stop:786 length:186 start_codon:yes stop_codon:yes gene_type:complete